MCAGQHFFDSCVWLAGWFDFDFEEIPLLEGGHGPQARPAASVILFVVLRQLGAQEHADTHIFKMGHQKDATEATKAGAGYGDCISSGVQGTAE